MRKKEIDIIDIKYADNLKFYVENDFIYCENAYGERIIVGDLYQDRFDYEKAKQ
jgi:hypothetical protein